MATVSPPSDQTAEMLQKLTLDPQGKSLEIPPSTKKTAVYHAGPVDANSQVSPFDRSVTPVLPDFVDPTLCYVQNGYQPYYFGGFGTGSDWNEYPSYTNNDGSGIDMASGIYGENGLAYAGYGYAPYPYSPATSPVPTAGTDGSLYGAQQYQYPPYFPLNPGSESFTPSMTGSLQSEQSANKVTDPNPLSETASIVSNSISKSGVAKANSSTRAWNQGSLHTSTNSCESGSFGGVFPISYQDPRLGYEGFPSPMPPHDSSKISDGRRQVSGSEFTSSFSRGNNIHSSQNLSYASNSHFMGSHQQVGAQGYYNGAYPNKSYGQYEGGLRSGVSYGSTGYDSRTNGRGWLAYERIRNRGRGNNYFHGNNTDGLNELNRGPRAKNTMNPTDVSDTTLVANGQNGISNVANSEGTVKACVAPDRAQYNREDFCDEYADAKFFVIKSYSEDDVHKSIKYNVWASTPNGNKKLDAAYQESQQKSSSCPVFLFFSVNTSGQFVGVAEMVGPVDFTKNLAYWQQDKWTGSFPLKWHIVKDVPNSLLRHITLENNENKPVTNSRDTQEVKLEQGLKMIKIFKDHSSKTCILDDFSFYETRQAKIQEKKAMLQQSQNQTLEGKSIDGQWESSNGDLKVSENGLVARKGDLSNSAKQDVVVANGVTNGC